MRSLSALALLGAVAAASIARAGSAGPLRAEVVKVYTGRDGLTVTLVWLKPRSEKKVLVKVSGADGDFEGRILPHEDLSSDGQLNLMTHWNGREWHTVQQRRAGGGGDQVRTEVFLPGHSDGYAVTYDDGRSQKVDVKDLLDEYAQTRDSPDLKKLAAYDRKGDVERNRKALDESAQETAKACNAKLDVAVDWASISDESLRTYSVSGYCGNVLSALKSLCGDAPSREVIADEVHHVRCGFGPSLGITSSRGTLRFTTAIDAANQEEWLRKALLRKL